MNSKSLTVGVVGSGPAGLMAATVLARAGVAVSIFEQHHSAARKLLIAGKSGLNVSHRPRDRELASFYTGESFEKQLQVFGRSEWLAFLHDLGIETFEGTSRRDFVKGLKAGPLVKAWVSHLEELGVTFHFDHCLEDFEVSDQGVVLTFNRQTKFCCDAAVLALGGASWLDEKHAFEWPQWLKDKGVGVSAFKPANAGFAVAWSEGFLKEADGLPLKNTVLHSEEGEFPGEVVVTQTGLEGTPVYNLIKPQHITLDLKPDLSLSEIRSKLEARKQKENMSPLRLVKATLNLTPAALALLFHELDADTKSDLVKLAEMIKAFPLHLTKQNDLSQAISSAGGVEFSALDDSGMLREYPGVFLAGEMRDWHAPTGGFLIQGCVTQGWQAAQALLTRLPARSYSSPKKNG